MKFTRETLKDFLLELCDLAPVNPIIVVTENDITIQSELNDLDEDEVNLGCAWVNQDQFLGDINGGNYEETTEKQIEVWIDESPLDSFNTQIENMIEYVLENDLLYTRTQNQFSQPIV